MVDMNKESASAPLPHISIPPEEVGGVWANFALVSHSPFEFTLDFVRLSYGMDPLQGTVVSRVNVSPLFVTQLMDALKANWDLYAAKALPKEVSE